MYLQVKKELLWANNIYNLNSLLSTKKFFVRFRTIRKGINFIVQGWNALIKDSRIQKKKLSLFFKYIIKYIFNIKDSHI